MTAERITVSLPPDVLAGAKSAVQAGAADNLSAFVADALRERLSRAQALTELARVLGGPPPLEARAAVRRAWGLPAPSDQT
ncbi:MAG TPA: ribbon-helix-helix domain-containing protein [Pseudonocardiaceae bacterium]|jgi:antitoxin ParD1/3/4|nr:ribbon-helix-helix domain-containing protein [Pseudonocardiaceae bacterium]